MGIRMLTVINLGREHKKLLNHQDSAIFVMYVGSKRPTTSEQVQVQQVTHSETPQKAACSIRVTPTSSPESFMYFIIRALRIQAI